MNLKPTPPEFLLRKYESVQFIGEGADGQVYKCVRDGVATAVKVLNSLDAVSRSRFAREVEILKRFDDEHIVKFFGAGETDGHHWLESEFANESHFGKMFPYLNYSNAERRDCFLQICLGVLALHEAEPRIIHRDLKPRNILVFQNADEGSDPILKIADFGLSAIAGECPRLTTSSQFLGTEAYMAPERKQNPRLQTVESDVYSLGITFLEACTGSTTQGDNEDNVPDVFKPIIKKMIRLSPNHRYHSVRDLLTDIIDLPMFELIYGHEIAPGEVPGPAFSTNAAGKLARIMEVMYNATPENIEHQVALLERTLDSLGLDVHDNKAHAISTLASHVTRLIDELLPDRLRQLIERFDYAAEHTNEDDFFYDGPDRWCRFLVETFKVGSYRPTRHACLAGMSKILVRFDTLVVRQWFGHLMYSIQDPGDAEHLALCLREHRREDLAKLLDGVPEDRSVDVEALKLALGIENAKA